MAYPAGVTTCNLTIGEAFSAFGDEDFRITAIVTPYFGTQTNRIVWGATGEVMPAFSKTYISIPGGSLTIPVPHVNQAGWYDPAGNAYTMWAYKVSITVTQGNQTLTWEQAVQPLTGQATVDLDEVPDGPIGAPVSAPLPAVLSVNGSTGHVTVSAGAGVSDHGALTGLADDDHTQYLNNTRGDVRYYTKSQVDTSLTSKADLVGGLVPTAQIPALAISDVFTVASQALMLALTAQKGDVAVRSDTGRRFILSTNSPTVLADWIDITAADAVLTVNGQAGVVVLAKSDIGLANVDNTADINKPVSTLQQAAINTHAADLTNVHGIVDMTNVALIIVEITTGNWSGDAPVRGAGDNLIIFVGTSDPADPTNGINTPGNLIDNDLWVPA